VVGTLIKWVEKVKIKLLMDDLLLNKNLLNIFLILLIFWEVV